MINPIKIAIGIVLGLFCWNYLIALSERQDRAERAAQMKQDFKAASENCDRGSQEACDQMRKLALRGLEQSVEDLKRQH